MKESEVFSSALVDFLTSMAISFVSVQNFQVDLLFSSVLSTRIWAISLVLVNFEPIRKAYLVLLVRLSWS